MNPLLEKLNNYYEILNYKFQYELSDGTIIDFNPKIMNSKLNAKYILFNKDKIQYNHLAIGEEKNKKFYVESFFSENTDKYIKNQKIEKVSKVIIFDNNEKIYLEDTF